MNLTLKEAAKILQVSDEFQTNPCLANCAFDSREVKPNGLFVCIPGKRNDGHDFIDQAIKNGAAAILAQKPVPNCPVPVLVVADTIKALGQLAANWRNKSASRVIAITGTSGKTTLKETLVSILKEEGEVASTPKNHNNQIGMPAAILNMSGLEKYWVIEAGISHEGDMDELGAIIQPDLAVILNAGPGHDEGLGKKGAAWHKARLLQYVKPEGIAVISADYPALEKETAKYPVKKLYFGVRNPKAAFIDESPLQAGNYKIHHDNLVDEISTPFQGDYGAENTLAAWTCAHLLGIPENKIRHGFKNLSLPEHRFNILEGTGWKIIDDTYNANPLSMERMLQTASVISKKEKSQFVTVLGEMLELGESANEWHYKLGKLLSGLDADLIFWKGNHLEDVINGYANAQGKGKIHYFKEEKDLSGILAKCGLRKPVTVFLKGSRANKLENCITTLKNAFQENRQNVL